MQDPDLTDMELTRFRIEMTNFRKLVSKAWGIQQQQGGQHTSEHASTESVEQMQNHPNLNPNPITLKNPYWWSDDGAKKYVKS